MRLTPCAAFTFLDTNTPVADTFKSSPATLPVNTALAVLTVALVVASYTLSLAAMPETVTPRRLILALKVVLSTMA